MKHLYILFFSLAFTSCASIVSKSHYPIEFTSHPNRAKVSIAYIDSSTPLFEGTTPIVFELPSGDGFFEKARYTITFEKDGIEKQVEIEPRFDGWFIGNLGFGGIVGMIIDGATGAMYKFDNDKEIHMHLGNNIKEHSFHIIDINDIPKEQRKLLVQVN